MRPVGAAVVVGGGGGRRLAWTCTGGAWPGAGAEGGCLRVRLGRWLRPPRREARREVAEGPDEGAWAWAWAGAGAGTAGMTWAGDGARRADWSGANAMVRKRPEMVAQGDGRGAGDGLQGGGGGQSTHALVGGSGWRAGRLSEDWQLWLELYWPQAARRVAAEASRAGSPNQHRLPRRCEPAAARAAGLGTGSVSPRVRRARRADTHAVRARAAAARP